MRQLKYHESRLLRKTSFTDWKDDNTPKEQIICQKYQIKNRNDFYKYSKLAFLARKIANLIAVLKNSNRKKKIYAERLINILFRLGIIPERKLNLCFDIKLIDFCERRLALILMRKKMCENLENAIEFVEHGHVELFGRVIRDSSVLVERKYEKYIKWRSGSKIQKKIAEHKNILDDSSE